MYFHYPATRRFRQKTWKLRSKAGATTPKAFIEDLASSGFCENKGFGRGAQSRGLKKPHLRADYVGLVVLFLPDGYAVLMRPNKAETAVHGCHCPGDMAVRMR